MIYLDTHVVIWLYAGRTDLVPSEARSLIDANDLLVSPIVGLELQYLFETDRTTIPAAVVLGTLAKQVGLQGCDLPFADVVEAACQESWTRDPFDRIVVAQCRLRGASLLTKDRGIRAHCELAVWDEPERRT